MKSQLYRLSRGYDLDRKFYQMDIILYQTDLDSLGDYHHL